jgi:hypothetical protein
MSSWSPSGTPGNAVPVGVRLRHAYGELQPVAPDHSPYGVIRPERSISMRCRQTVNLAREYSLFVRTFRLEATYNQLEMARLCQCAAENQPYGALRLANENAENRLLGPTVR